MSTKDIRTAPDELHTVCDVCGRTLLRGERSQTFLEGETRRNVCELCTGRAQNEGWLREGTIPPYEGRADSGHRTPLLRRLRRRLTPPEVEPDGERAKPRREPQERTRSSEPRHVRAIPTSVDQRLAVAVETFNASEHPRTIAGIARSLGLPSVTVQGSDSSPGTIRILVAWELCWYRYEVDLRDDPDTARLLEQGAELDELAPGELQANAWAQENGTLTLN